MAKTSASTAPRSTLPLLAAPTEVGTVFALSKSVHAICCIALFAAFGLQQITLRGADARGQWFDVASERGHLVAITFASRTTADDARTINDALANHGVFVVSVVDLRDVPRIAHNLALKKIRKSDRPGKMLHLVDSDGHISRQLGVDPRRQVDVILVDRAGQMLGRFAGVEELGEIEQRIDHARTRAAR
jgi:hypothetical protein